MTTAGAAAAGGTGPSKRRPRDWHPAALFHIIGNTVFLRLQRRQLDKPAAHTRKLIMVQQMSRKDRRRYSGYSQRSAYQYLYSELRTGPGRKASGERLHQADGGLPPIAARLSRRLHQRGDTVDRPQRHGQADRERTAPGRRMRPTRRRQALIDLAKVEKAGGPADAGLHHPHRHPRPHRRVSNSS